MNFKKSRNNITTESSCDICCKIMTPEEEAKIWEKVVKTRPVAWTGPKVSPAGSRCYSCGYSCKPNQREECVKCYVPHPGGPPN